ncbi:hypothetical protein NUU61_005621 [Penicillium alfredii]|uniref:Clr5 domain-containing protein n=1 Tax=Penicillium alfredii TaxID=1506179 RepID=A0A9W9FA10_9EURO|nr:uncharacterized protein NUU61_005621 [Penicillium alfredii]KAJ5096265.1 hypothetical protein NUU61_005621 [Penicillium alfredii]
MRKCRLWVSRLLLFHYGAQQRQQTPDRCSTSLCFRVCSPQPHLHGGRVSSTMVYDWAGKRDICYQMYIQDKKALEEIMEHMRTAYQFAPSKRAFQTQFKRWGFPSKQNPAHKNVDLVARVKQLWEKNTSQRDMLRILNEEGFEIKERELMRVRAKNRWLLRVPNGMKSQSTAETRATQPEDEGLLALQQEVYKQEGAFDDADSLAAEPAAEPSTSPGLSPEVLAKRKERLERLKTESAERWASRKRRRRTRGWAGLPADPPGPPRFPSETTIDESKHYLNLDNAMYRQIRDHFQKICEDSGFIKKTAAGPERWQAAKDRLIQESPHLQQVFHIEPNQRDAKALALDVVCTDVTKRMRTLERRMTIAEAKNALGINPEESRHIRNAFYDTLKADHFTSKLEAGDEHWKELKEQWVANTALLQQILAPGPADPDHTTKVKALEVLCRDVMKRLRDDQTKRDPSRKRSVTESESQNSVPANPVIGNVLDNGISNGISTLASQALASAPITASEIGDMQIDPSLLQAANDPSFSANTQHDGGNAFQYVDPMLQPTLLHTPVHLQICPQDPQGPAVKTWLEKLATRTVEELRQSVAARYPYSIIIKIEGIDRDEHGNELSFSIDEDHELDSYLAHVHGRKALIVLTLSQI